MQKIDDITLETYKIIVSTISVLNKDGREKFIKESFLVADVKLDIIIKMLFLTMSHANIDF